MIEMQQGCWVIQINQQKHEEMPRLYPKYGTVGKIVRIGVKGHCVKWFHDTVSRVEYLYPPQDLLYIGIPNQYGYRYNVNHPIVRNLYERYKQKIGCPKHFPVSDQQRWEFERKVDKLILNQKYNPEEIFGK